MNETMTYADMVAKFKSEWILVGDPVTNECLEVQSGTVLWHSKDREEVHKKALELRPKRAAFLFIGPRPEGMLLVL